MATESSSPLLRMPGELRNDIFELALTYSKPIVTSLSLEQKLVMQFSPDILALTQTCRQVYHECAGLFVSCNDFLVIGRAHLTDIDSKLQCSGEETAYALGPLNAFLSRIGSLNAKALTAVSVRLPIIDISDMEEYGRGASGTLTEYRQIDSILRELKRLALASPHWHLTAKVTLCFVESCGRTSFVLPHGLVGLQNPKSSLRAFCSSLQRDLDLAEGGKWDKREVRAAITALQGWEEMLAGSGEIMSD
ncbi:hypothetical protein LTR85_008234 [Meristemomyces frigidus]|nr:hypothetical protein LTR85_008234 [Meristemomyces frigidus]